MKKCFFCFILVCLALTSIQAQNSATQVDRLSKALQPAQQTGVKVQKTDTATYMKGVTEAMTTLGNRGGVSGATPKPKVAPAPKPKEEFRIMKPASIIKKQ